MGSVTEVFEQALGKVIEDKIRDYFNSDGLRQYVDSLIRTAVNPAVVTRKLGEIERAVLQVEANFNSYTQDHGSTTHLSVNTRLSQLQARTEEVASWIENTTKDVRVLTGAFSRLEKMVGEMQEWRMAYDNRYDLLQQTNIKEFERIHAMLDTVRIFMKSEEEIAEEKATQRAAAEIDYEKLADHLDYQMLGNNIKKDEIDLSGLASDIADEISIGDIAEEIDLDDLAEKIDINDELVDKVIEKIAEKLAD